MPCTCSGASIPLATSVWISSCDAAYRRRRMSRTCGASKRSVLNSGSCVRVSRELLVEAEVTQSVLRVYIHVCGFCIFKCAQFCAPPHIYVVRIRVPKSDADTVLEGLAAFTSIPQLIRHFYARTSRCCHMCHSYVTSHVYQFRNITNTFVVYYEHVGCLLRIYL